MNGRIISLNAGVYTVLTEEGIEINAKARGKLRKMKLSKSSSFNKGNGNVNSNKIDTMHFKLSPKVGDLVTLLKEDEQTYTIQDIKPRTNELIRPDIANVDQILLVFASKNPDFSTYLLDSFLVNLATQKITPLIVISKIDLLSKEELCNIKEIMSYYEEKLHYPVFYVNSKEPTTLSPIIPYLKDKITVLTGQTGAGKSTFINALIPGFSLQTQDISYALNRGKHTTRKIDLYSYFGGLIGDTPGFSKLDLEATKSNLKDHFVEFNSNECRYKDCMHLPTSKDCGVRAKAGNEILKSRYDNYLKIYEKLER